MFSRIGGMELLIIFAIALLIFGPKNLPKLGKSIGQTFGNFRKGQKEGMADEGGEKADDSDGDVDEKK